MPAIKDEKHLLLFMAVTATIAVTVRLLSNGWIVGFYQLPKLPSDAPRMQIDREAIIKLILSSDNGSAPGPSGWGSNMLSILADDPESVQPWTKVNVFRL